MMFTKRRNIWHRCVMDSSVIGITSAICHPDQFLCVLFAHSIKFLEANCINSLWIDDWWCYFTCLSQNRVGPDMLDVWIISSLNNVDDIVMNENKKPHVVILSHVTVGFPRDLQACKKPNMHSVTQSQIFVHV